MGEDITTSSMSNSMFLDRTLQQPGLLTNVDDWSGSTSLARRKIQNRINQRVHRKRKREVAKLRCSTSSESTSVTSTGHFGTLARPGCSTKSEQIISGSDAPLDDVWRLFYSAVRSQYVNYSTLIQVGKLCKSKGIESDNTVMALIGWVKRHSSAYSASPDCLLVLVKFNVFRALLNNGKMLGFKTAREYLDDDALSPFVDPTLSEDSFSSLPPALRPTDFQRHTPHHPWLDLFPDPVMRDNLIRASGTYNAEDLCTDLIGLSSDSVGRSGLIIWGEPWDSYGWEVTAPFLKHWGWTLRGCDNLFRATNYWRKKRGEPSFNFEQILGN